MPLFNDDARLIPSPYLGFVSGKYYASTSFASTTIISFASGYLYYTYFFVFFQQNFSKLAFYSNYTHSNMQQARAAIYNVASGLPTTLLVDFGTISFTFPGLKEVSSSVSLAPGWYAIALMFSPNAISLNVPSMCLNMLGQTTPSMNIFTGFRVPLSFGSFPSTASLVNLLESITPLVWLKTF